jgi:hypothetical protein
MDDKLAELDIRTALSKLPLCGCGRADKMREIVRDVLARAAQPWPKDGRTRRISLDEAMPQHDLSDIAVEFVAQALSETGHLEHGGSVGGSWLSEAGRLVLDFLREYGCDPGNIGDEAASWPAWATCAMDGEPYEAPPAQWHALTTASGAFDPP